MNRRDFLCYTKLFTLAATISPLAAAGIEISDDLYLEKKDLNDFISVKNKLNQVKRIVGYGNFNIISFDYTLKIAKGFSNIKPFTNSELQFMEKIFYANPARHGFYGERICSNITQTISKKEVKKIPYTGHYLFQGKPIEDYDRLKKDVGSTLVLTSGVRSIVKQMNLFLNRIHRNNGNISESSKSIAPPAYSYHTISDFDVGKKGWGYKNFTTRFTATEEFMKMKKLNYIGMRYTINNKDGVRFEPWHVKVI